MRHFHLYEEKQVGLILLQSVGTMLWMNKQFSQAGFSTSSTGIVCSLLGSWQYECYPASTNSSINRSHYFYAPPVEHRHPF